MSEKRTTEILEQGQESLTGYQASISSDHAYIHKGKAFTALIDIGSISAAYNIAFKTPTVASGLYVHWRPTGITSSTDYVKITLREGDTYTGGTAVTPINRNRLSSITTDMQAFVSGATSTPVGTVLNLTGVGTAGNPTAKSGGGSGENEELVLKQNTVHVMTLLPTSATVCTAKLFWYEEDMGLMA